MNLALKALRKVLTDPIGTAYILQEKVACNKLYDRYAVLAKRAGIDRPYFILSFDCDTTDDISVAWDIHSRLLNMGVRPVYAVPGEILKKGEPVFRRILESGGEFINHGYTEHTYFDTARDRYASCFFYDELTLNAVRDDIVRGDECLREVLGITPKGFRTPHFGTFQRPHQLRFLHDTLKELGYLFSTSTTPLYAYRLGPLFRNFGVCEIPVSGMGTSPLTILDTWGCFAAPNRTLSQEDYRREGKLAGEILGNMGTGIMNYYADPSHIHESEIFFETVGQWLAVAQSVTYGELLENLKWSTES